MAMEYQGFATLGVNLNRQKYGPLDVSTVFTSVEDLTYYTSKGEIQLEGLSDYWKSIIPYPYAGQIVALVVDKNVFVYKLVENDSNSFDAKELGGTADLTDYATKTYVQELINNIPNNVEMIALTKEEILELCQ